MTLLGKIKIHEIAKKLNLNSKEVVEKAKELGIEAKTHLSGVEEDEAIRIEESFTNKQVKKEKEKVKEEKTKQSSPVIIRREVIINDTEKPKQEEKKQETSRKEVGFVEQERKKDFNIVYRNKPKDRKSVV